MREDHHDLSRLYQPEAEEAFDDVDRAAAESLDRGDAFAFLSDAEADELWGDEDTDAWRDDMDARYEAFHQEYDRDYT